MALTNCRECKGEISEWATTCPHCGARDPVKSQWQITVFVGWATFLLIAAVIIKVVFFK
ncbi:MAG TPA: hypothetical protein VG942_19205 [Hyphomonadaceae bacterium]|nr:hypothetical protein [Hyphomonadaceae bacterium]